MADNIMTLTELKKQFNAWQVPSKQHFHALIDLAALTFKPGPGLSGGDPSMNADVIDAGKVTPLQVKPHYGMTVTDGSIAVLAAPNGGLEVKNGKLTLKPPSGVICKGDGLALWVNVGKALQVGESVAVQIKKTNAGLRCDEKTGVSLLVDNKTVEINANGALRVKCANTGGLTIDNGYLEVDLDIILERPCIRAYQGQVQAYIPKETLKNGDKVYFYLHDVYVGEINHDGAIPGDSKIKKEKGIKDDKYWNVQLFQWVKKDDNLRARLIKNGQDEKTGTDIARHTVTTAEAAPTAIPSIEVNIVNTPGSVLTEVRAGDTLLIKHNAGAANYSWRIKNTETNSWNNTPDNSRDQFMVPAATASGVKICVLLELNDNNNKGQLAFSQVVTVK